MEIYYWLGELEECRGLADLLWSRRPIPFQYAFAVLRGVLSPPEDLPRRLREEWPESFDAKFMAATIEGDKLARPREAIREAKKLAAEYGSQDFQDRLAKLLHSLAEHLPPEEWGPDRESAAAMLDPTSRSARLYEVEALVHEAQVR